MKRGKLLLDVGAVEQALVVGLSALLMLALAGCDKGTSSSVAQPANVTFDISPDGKQIAFSSEAGDLFLLELSTQRVSQLTESATLETAPSFAPDGKSIVYCCAEPDRQAGHLFRISLDGAHCQQLTTESGVFDSIPTYSSDGRQIAFARAHRHRPYSMGGWTWDDWDVYRMDADGGDVTRLTHSNYYGIGGIALPASGDSILFSAENNRATSDLQTNVFEVATGGTTPPKPAVRQPSTPNKCATWASDPNCSRGDEKIVCISDRGAPYAYDLVVIDGKSGDATSLNATSVSRYNQHPVFAPDSRRIFFLAARAYNRQSRPIFSLWSIDVDGKNAKEIAGSQLFTDPMKWSPSK